MDPALPIYLTKRQVCLALGVGKLRLAAMIEAGEVPLPVKIAGRGGRRWIKSQVDASIDAKKSDVTAPTTALRTSEDWDAALNLR